MSRLQHKKGRKSNYSKSLDNDNHREVRRQALIRDNFECKICKSKLFLELHHISYYANGHCIIGNELNNMEWVVIVCSEHHKQIHQDLNHVWNPKNGLKTKFDSYRIHK